MLASHCVYFQSIGQTVYAPAELALLADQPLLSYPVAATPKLDGIRCLIKDGVALSRTLKPIPNKALQALLGRPLLEGLDGELVAPGGYSQTESIVMSKLAPIEDSGLVFWVFDCWDRPQLGYATRLELIRKRLAWAGPSPDLAITVVPCHIVLTLSSLLQIEKQYLDEGLEGLIVRQIDGPYKYGRSTQKEGWMLKVKRFQDSEASILDVVEAQANWNPVELDERGYSTRASSKAGRSGSGAVGSLVVQDLHGLWAGQPILISAGKLTQKERQAMWAKPANYEGRMVKYKFFPTPNFDSVPRHPTFLSFVNSTLVAS